MKHALRDVDAIAWDGFLWMWGRIGYHASGDAARDASRRAYDGNWRFA